MGMFVPKVTIQSARRPHHVEGMLAALNPIVPIWYVPANEAAEYEQAGARVRPVEGKLPMKPKQLNAALDDGMAESSLIITMDDDFAGAKGIWIDDVKYKTADLPLPFVLKEMTERLLESDKMLAINGFLGNLAWANDKPVYWGTGSGQLMVHKPGPVRFDEKLNDTEDLDYIIQHHLNYGGLVKLRKFSVDFHEYKPDKRANYTGGYEGYRSDETIKGTVMYLREKYPFLEFEEAGVNDAIFSKIKWRDLAR